MKKFVISILLFFLPIILLVANYLTLSSVRECSGDLGKMAKFFFEKGYHEKAAFICEGICATINHIWEQEAYSAQDFMPLVVMAEYMRVIKDMANETH